MTTIVPTRFTREAIDYYEMLYARAGKNFFLTSFTTGKSEHDEMALFPILKLLGVKLPFEDDEIRFNSYLDKEIVDLVKENEAAVLFLLAAGVGKEDDG